MTTTCKDWSENETDAIKLAKEIDDCENCPLFHEDCAGGWTSSPAGTPIEPPCCNWNDDDEIYAGMYDRDYDYSERELEWIKEDRIRKEKAEREERKQKYQDELRERVYRISKYGSSKLRQTPSICSDWWCHICNRWVHPAPESWSGGIGEATCPRSGMTWHIADCWRRNQNDL